LICSFFSPDQVAVLQTPAQPAAAAMTKDEVSLSFAPSDEDFAPVLEAVRSKRAKKLRFFEGGLDESKLAALMHALNTQQTVHTLWLWKNPVPLLESVFDYPFLVCLSLELDGIDDTGAAHIARAMAKCCNLEVLLLNGNHITSKGAESIAHALCDQWSLRMLALGENDITDVGALALVSALDAHKRLKSLNLDLNKGISASVLLDVRTRFPVTSLHLSR
jgi:hypothetical protein